MRKTANSTASNEKRSWQFRWLLSLLVVLFLLPLLNAAPAQARKKTSAHKTATTSSKRKVVSNKRYSSRKSKAHVGKVSRSRTAGASRSSRKAVGRAVRAPEVGISPPDYDMEPRRRNYALLQDGYRLYDQGLSERIKGNYGLAIDKLTEAANLLDQARSHQRDGKASTLESMVLFELGLCAEEDNDLSLARDSYAKAFRANPRYVEAYLRGACLQAENGNRPLALSIIKEGLQNVSDPRLDTMLELLDGAEGLN